MSNSTSKQHWKLKFSIQPSYSQAKADPSIAWARLIQVFWTYSYTRQDKTRQAVVTTSKFIIAKKMDPNIE